MEAWDVILIWLFWLSAGVVVYAYVAYPVLIWILSRLFGQQPLPPELPTTWPRVSLLISAFNEESDIAKRIKNALAMDYPREQLEIVIASDGSTDRTSGIVQQYAEHGIRLYDYPERQGKPAVLNRSVPRLNGEIVVF